MDINNLDDPEPMFLGSFTPTVAATGEVPVQATFEFCGETFTIRPDLSAAPFMAFAEAALTADDISDLRFLATMSRLIRDCLPTAEDHARFMAAAHAKHADAKLIAGVCRTIYTYFTVRPTMRPADSSVGPPSTSTISNEPSSPSPASGPKRRRHGKTGGRSGTGGNG